MYNMEIPRYLDYKQGAKYRHIDPKDITKVELYCMAVQLGFYRFHPNNNL